MCTVIIILMVLICGFYDQMCSYPNDETESHRYERFSLRNEFVTSTCTRNFDHTDVQRCAFI